VTVEERARQFDLWKTCANPWVHLYVNLHLYVDLQQFEKNFADQLDSIEILKKIRKMNEMKA
jgi:hypothetical protein